MILFSTFVSPSQNDWWTEGDLNPRLPLCESGDHTGLIYRPTHIRREKIYAGDLEVSVNNIHKIRDYIDNIRSRGEGRSQPLNDLLPPSPLNLLKTGFA